MKKFLTAMIAITALSPGAQSQTVKENIDKAIRENRAKDHSAKADVIIQKKVIADSTTANIPPKKTVSKAKGENKIKHKRKKYKTQYRSSK